MIPLASWEPTRPALRTGRQGARTPLRTTALRFMVDMGYRLVGHGGSSWSLVLPGLRRTTPRSSWRNLLRSWLPVLGVALTRIALLYRGWFAVRQGIRATPRSARRINWKTDR